jgi:hypothetical protein
MYMYLIFNDFSFCNFLLLASLRICQIYMLQALLMSDRNIHIRVLHVLYHFHNK